MKIKYYFVNFFFVENTHGIEQLVKIWQLLLIAQTIIKDKKMVKND